MRPLDSAPLQVADGAGPEAGELGQVLLRQVRALAMEAEEAAEVGVPITGRVAR